jgi:hypothetical protein
MMTTVYRAITREDTLAVTEYALRVLREAAKDEPLHVAPLKVRDAVAFFANKGQGHFNLAAFEDKKVVGALALYVGEMPFFERCEGSVYFWPRLGAGRGLPAHRRNDGLGARGPENPPCAMADEQGRDGRPDG